MRIRSRTGGFNGRTGDTVVKLMTEQAWQQAIYRHIYHYAFKPVVEITSFYRFRV